MKNVIGNNITRLRQERGWSREGLDTRIPVARGTTGAIESGRRVPRPELLAAIAARLGEPVSALTEIYDPSARSRPDNRLQYSHASELHCPGETFRDDDSRTYAGRRAASGSIRTARYTCATRRWQCASRRPAS